MPDPAVYRPAPGTIPESPGVYKFRDPKGRVIYVGKAKSLRQRLNSYFADIAALHPRTRQMVTSAGSVEWTVVSTEVEALQLEYNWIKEFDPRFNVRYRDDKSYPFLAVTVGEEYPRLQVMRGAHRKGVRYFGPYAHAWAIRETLDLLLRVFPARTCSAGVFRRSAQIGRPCLLGYIGKCSAPCVGRVSAQEHREIVEGFCDFMAGKADPLIRRLEKQMTAAAADLDFERAARLRDDLSAVRRAVEKQAVVFGDGTDADVIGIAADELLASVQLFHVRDGRVRGERGWIVDVDADVDADGNDRDGLPLLVENFLLQFYGDLAADGDAGGPTSSVPREILVPVLPSQDAGTHDEMVDWLSALRGSRVSLRVAQRGDKRALAETVARNAQEALTRHRLKRAGDLTARSAALSELGETLGMDVAPLRIECIDISHVQGTDVVASLVVFEDGLAKRSDYRRFAIRDKPGDDVASIAEVVRRRFTHQARAEAGERAEADSTPAPTPTPTPAGSGVPAGIDPTTGRVRRFAYPPQLLVVDGGAPQVNAAATVLSELGIVDITVCGLAKRLEEVWLPFQADPVIFPRTSEALYLLQRLRDEAHRFAITYHRAKRSKSMTVSALDNVPGLGEVRRKALVRHFGSVAALRRADVEQILQVPGVGRRTAEAVVAALAGSGGAGTDTVISS
ncbi:excinuclease ABC subunit UvrC [Nakamurella multipartita]|uniref:UvrABC system protein C n=1 Tax=Nakamurella multipartita (strain ATCC 700099 / DSM 44233 / CIP 104796 / JCM 9543 / NBRC 105858 / Y-104) TaxID=479431 RepID=C8X9I3_NAKMY|nr:excinuclease ABC subunit UvrC [Nakamurella multipartita]ACV79141.1 excinuclease ABC, C subunit [Nakamurella multipartita DSM 44233]